MGAAARGHVNPLSSPEKRARPVMLPARRRRPRVLVADPDPLTLWSLRTYLRQWFDVDAADQAEAALAHVRRRSVDALVISEDFPARWREDVVAAARHRNPDVTVVWTYAKPAPMLARSGLCRLEKPFSLGELARRLGVPADQVPQAD